MDITKIATEVTHHNEATPVTLYDAAGNAEVDSQGNPVVFQVVSDLSDAARKLTQIQRTMTGKLLRRFGAYEKIPAPEIDAMADERVATCITGWAGIEANGQPMPFTHENAVAVVSGLRKFRPKQLQQIESAIAEHASFFTTPSAS